MIAAGPRRRWRRGRCVLALNDKAINAHRTADVLELLLADIGKLHIELVGDLIADRLAYADTTGQCMFLQPRRDIDPVAENVVAVDQYVAEIDADAQKYLAARFDIGIASRQSALNFERTFDRIRSTREFCEHAVAGSLDDAAAILDDGRVDQFEAMGLEAGKRGDSSSSMSRLKPTMSAARTAASLRSGPGASIFRLTERQSSRFAALAKVGSRRPS